MMSCNPKLYLGQRITWVTMKCTHKSNETQSGLVSTKDTPKPYRKRYLWHTLIQQGLALYQDNGALIRLSQLMQSGWVWHKEETPLHRDYLTCPDVLSCRGFNWAICWKNKGLSRQPWGNPATHLPTLMVVLWCHHISVSPSDEGQPEVSGKKRKVYAIVWWKASLEAGYSLSLKLANILLYHNTPNRPSKTPLLNTIWQTCTHMPSYSALNTLTYP